MAEASLIPILKGAAVAVPMQPAVLALALTVARVARVSPAQSTA
jgi:hypothetical protein